MRHEAQQRRGSPRRILQHKVDLPKLHALLAGRGAGRVMEALEECLLSGSLGVCDAEHGQQGWPSLLHAPPGDKRGG